MRLSMWMCMTALALIVCSAPEGQALTVNNSTGEISNWGFTPFGSGPYGNWTNSGINGAQSGFTGGVSWAEGNNVAGPPTFDFPKGGGSYQFSPSGTAGEGFDLEFMAWRVNGTQVQVLGITSADPNNGVNYQGTNFKLGDVFIDTDGSDATGYRGYDVALRAGSWTSTHDDTLHKGDGTAFSHTMGEGLYRIEDVNDIHGICGTDGYGNNPLVAPVMNPFAIRNGAEQIQNANVALEIWGDEAGENFNFNTLDGTPFDETKSFILEWTFDLAALPFPFEFGNLEFHWTIQCGNDFIEIPQQEPVIPEPATIALLGIGLAGLGIVRKRRFGRSTTV